MTQSTLPELDRRGFLRNLALAGSLATFAPQAAFAGLRSGKKKLGVALVGLGYYSTDLLAPALQLTKNCFLAGIVTGTPVKAEIWKKKYNLADKNIYNYENFDSIADNPDIDVVYVVLPPSMHRDFVVRAAKAGKEVWCEKPMAPTVADCEAMIKACADAKVSLAIGYRCQHDPVMQAYQRFARENTFGKVLMVSTGAGYFDPRSDQWKRKKAMGGGVVADMGVYTIQGARHMTGEEPIAVTAQFHTTRPEIYTEVEETALFQLEFRSGALATCQASFGVQMNYLQANCQKGWVKLDPFSSYSGNKGSSPQGLIEFPVQNQQARQMDNDSLAIIEGRPLLCPGEEGLKDIRVIEAIYAAAKSGQRVAIGGVADDKASGR